MSNQTNSGKWPSLQGAPNAWATKTAPPAAGKSWNRVASGNNPPNFAGSYPPRKSATPTKLANSMHDSKKVERSGQMDHSPRPPVSKKPRQEQRKRTGVAGSSTSGRPHNAASRNIPPEKSIPMVHIQGSQRRHDKQKLKNANKKAAPRGPVRGTPSAASLQMKTSPKPDAQPEYTMTDSDFPTLSAVKTGTQHPSRPKLILKPPQKLEPKRKSETAKVPKAKKKKDMKTKASVDSTKPDLSNHPFFTQKSVVAAARDLAGGENDLLRLVQEGNILSPKKGRQRLRPRTKKFSTLKKKILEERLRRWQELHPEPALEMESSTVSIHGFTSVDEVEDDDEFWELLMNLKDMASKVGEVRRLFIPRTLEESNDAGDLPVFVEYLDRKIALAAETCWDGLVLGGSTLRAKVLSSIGEAAPENESDWEIWCQRVLQTQGTPLSSTDTPEIQKTSEIFLDNVLSEDDLDDADCLEESLMDIRAMTEGFGRLDSVRVQDGAPNVILTFVCGESEAAAIVEQLKGLVIGGSPLKARMKSGSETSSNSPASRTIVLRNVLTDDDVDDTDCLEESVQDLKELAQPFGDVSEIWPTIETRSVSVVYNSEESISKALEAFDGMVVGGITISASKASSPAVSDPVSTSDEKPKELFSGDKRIPERFARMKRVPKIPNSGKPRNYAVLCQNENAKTLLSEMLSELMRLQKRALEDKNSKVRRRVVMGLREVARGIRAHKVKMVVMANNMDVSGVIDEKLQEIIDSAIREEVPVFFEFSKRSLGKLVGKTIKVAVVGIQNAEGAHQQFKKLVGVAPVLVPSEQSHVTERSADE